MDHDTTYFCVIDSAGNAASFIQSIFWVFGSAAVAPGTGILFNNRMTGFSMDSQSPNVVAPGKRTAHTLNAYRLSRGRTGSARHRLAFVGGTPGGDVQVQSNLQVVCNVIDYGMRSSGGVRGAAMAARRVGWRSRRGRRRVAGYRRPGKSGRATGTGFTRPSHRRDWPLGARQQLPAYCRR